MSKNSVFSILRFLLVIAMLIILGISFFEPLASTECAKNAYNHPNVCRGLLEEHFGRKLTDEENNQYIHFMNSENVSKIDNSKIEEIIKYKTIFIPRYKMNNVNGIPCGLFNFVADDMTSSAGRYVSIHEAIHSLGMKNETKVNYTAVKLEPIGFIETVFYSIFGNLSFAKLDMVPCRVGRMWNTFKVYFLGSKF